MSQQDNNPPPENAKPAPSLLRYLIPRRGFWGVAVLVDLNIAVYLAMVLSGLGVMEFPVNGLVAWGGNYGASLEGIEAYRLVTSTFVHAGLLHIATNM